MMDLGTPLGLGLASGINAYFPLFALALYARLFHSNVLNEHFTFLSSDAGLLVLAILVIVDFVADKIPVLDHFWDGVHTLIRPLAGALVAVASSRQVPFMLTMSSVSGHLLTGGSVLGGVGVGLLVVALLGGILAAMAHTAKATTRFFSTITTAGLLNILLSVGEDILVVILVLLSLLLPAIMLVLLVIFLLRFGPTIFRAWRGWLRLRGGW